MIPSLRSVLQADLFSTVIGGCILLRPHSLSGVFAHKCVNISVELATAEKWLEE